MPYTDSASVTIELPLLGVWIHDPEDPEGTVYSFPYGSNSRDDSYDAMGSGTYYVGKESPVFDYGEPSAFSVSVALDIPHGPTYRADVAKIREFAAIKRAIVYRDNRGRVVYGEMSSLKVSDAGYGSAVSFIVTQAYRAVSEVTS